MTNPNRGPFADEGEYQGKPQITLKWRADSQYPCSLGIGKVRLILACLPALQAFAAKHPDEGIGNRGHGRPTPSRSAPNQPLPRRDLSQGYMDVAPLPEKPPFDPTGGAGSPPPC